MIEGQQGAGWLTSFLQYDPPTQPGAGCATGFVSTECPTDTLPAVTVEGGDGEDTIGVEGRGVPPGPVALRGGAGADNLYTIGMKAEIDGGPGDDLLQPDQRVALGGLPPPTPGGVIRGGPGDDTVSYAVSLDFVAVSLDGVAGDGRSGDGDDVRPDVENVSAGDFGAALSGSAAANELTGGAGDDRLDGGGGRDSLAGNGGGDHVSALDARGGDTVDCGVGPDVAWVDAGDELFDAAACERVGWAPSAGAPRFKNGRIEVRLACPRVARRCRGGLSLRGADGGAGYDLAGGRAGRARLRPTRATRARLRAGRAVKSELRLAPRGSSFAAPAGRAVTIRPRTPPAGG